MKSKSRLFLVMILIASMALGLVACGGNDAGEAAGEGLAGEYIGIADGYGGDLEVTVELDDDGEILNITVGDNDETEDIASLPLEEIPGQIVDKQSLEVDNISGATVTVDAIVAAVANALEEAGLDPADYGYTALADGGSELDYEIDKSMMPEKKEITGSVTVTDVKGREVEINLPISSYGISTMDVIDYIIPLKGEDAFHMLVGSGQDGGQGFDKYAELYVPEVGNYLKHTGQISDHNAPLDLEMILSMEPDVLIINSAMGAHKYAMEVEEQLAEIGTKIVLIDVPGENIDSSVQETMEVLGQIFEEEEKAAEVIAFMDEQFELLGEKDLKARDDKPTVYYEKSGYSEIFGPTSTSERGWGLLVDIAGGENIADELLLESGASKGGSNTLDPEYVLDKDPDYIILSAVNDGWLDILNEKTEPTFDIIKRNGWDNLQAVKEDKLHEFAHATSRSIYAFYPSLKMAKIFYPEEFEDLDPEAKLDEFFDKFMILDSDINTWYHNLSDAK